MFSQVGESVKLRDSEVAVLKPYRIRVEPLGHQRIPVLPLEIDITSIAGLIRLSQGDGSGYGLARLPVVVKRPITKLVMDQPRPV